MVEAGSREARWKFYGYVTPAGRRSVQDWFDHELEADDRDEIIDILVYLSKLPRHLWAVPHFKALHADVSEIRINVNKLKKIHRIYGCFWPDAGSYTFLIGKNKKVDNDRRGKQEAEKRLRQLRRKEADIHEFSFESEPDRQD